MIQINLSILSSPRPLFHEFPSSPYKAPDEKDDAVEPQTERNELPLLTYFLLGIFECLIFLRVRE